MNGTISINLTEFGSVIGALLVLGAILKNAFPNFPNRFIPLLTWVSGVLAYQVSVNGWADGKQWLAAVIAAATATGAHSSIKNTFEKAEVPPAVGLWLLFFALTVAAGCAPLQPGADPVVVRAEQTQTFTEGSMDLITAIDHEQRAWWRTNAPAFHDFVETLRDDVPVSGLPDGRTTLKRGLAAQWEFDQAKLRYKLTKSVATSNAVETARLTLQTIGDQTRAWLTIVTNSPQLKP